MPATYTDIILIRYPQLHILKEQSAATHRIGSLHLPLSPAIGNQGNC